MSKWQPIETAPKDGTEIIAVDVDALIPTPFVVCWGYGMWIVGGDTVFKFAAEGFMGVHDICYIAPTHWMPLPEPPK